MKPQPECFRCLLTTRLREVENTGLSDEEKVKVAIAITERLIQSFTLNSELTKLATELYRYLVSIVPDVVNYYRVVKSRFNTMALQELNQHIEYIKRLSEYERFEYLIKLSVLGNLIDYGVADHKPLENSITPDLVFTHEFYVNHTPELYKLISRGGLKIAWLFDNAGEVVYDSLLIREIKRYGNSVYGFVKTSPGFQNDVTMEDIVETGVDKVLDGVVEYGSMSTIHMEKIPKEVEGLLKNLDLIIAKGMSHYEYLSEVSLDIPICFMLVPKCDVVAKSIGINSKGKIVVLCRGIGATS